MDHLTSPHRVVSVLVLLEFFDLIAKQGHNESLHENVQYSCNLCEYKTKQQGHLNTHIESVHEKVRYPCIQCHKEFITQGYLKIYIESVQLCKWEI